MEVLENIPVKLEAEKILKRLHFRKEYTNVERSIQKLFKIVNSVAKPRAIYEVSYVENRNEDYLYIAGIKFTSRVLRVNLDKVERVFPYVATSGREIDEIEILFKDLAKHYTIVSSGFKHLLISKIYSIIRECH